MIKWLRKLFAKPEPQEIEDPYLYVPVIWRDRGKDAQPEVRYVARKKADQLPVLGGKTGRSQTVRRLGRRGMSEEAIAANARAWIVENSPDCALFR